MTWHKQEWCGGGVCRGENSKSKFCGEKSRGSLFVRNTHSEQRHGVVGKMTAEWLTRQMARDWTRWWEERERESTFYAASCLAIGRLLFLPQLFYMPLCLNVTSGGRGWVKRWKVHNTTSTVHKQCATTTTPTPSTLPLTPHGNGIHFGSLYPFVLSRPNVTGRVIRPDREKFAIFGTLGSISYCGIQVGVPVAVNTEGSESDQLTIERETNIGPNQSSGMSDWPPPRCVWLWPIHFRPRCSFALRESLKNQPPDDLSNTDTAN